MQSFIINSPEVFIHIHKGYFAGTGAIVRLPQCQWSKPDGYEKISQCITTTKPSKAKTVCIFLGINCNMHCSDIFEWVISWWQVSGNGLVPSGNLQLPESVMTKCRHLPSLGAYWVKLNSIIVYLVPRFPISGVSNMFVLPLLKALNITTTHYCILYVPSFVGS